MRVHLMVHEPERDFGNTHRPLGVFDAVELIHIDFAEVAHVENLLLSTVDFLEDFDFQQAKSAIGEDKEVAAAAGRIEEAERAEFLVERFEVRAAARGTVALESSNSARSSSRKSERSTFMMSRSLV